MASRRSKSPARGVSLRDTLVSAGLETHLADLLADMPHRVVQVEPRRPFREQGVQRDEVMKLTNLPAWQVEALTVRSRPDKEPGPGTALFGFLVPALQKVRRAQARLEQNLALYAWHGRQHVAHITALRKRMGW